MWAWAKSLGVRTWALLALIGGAILAFVLSGKKKPPAGAPLESKIDRRLGYADRLAEERDQVGQDITKVDAEIAKIESRASGLEMDEVAKRLNARKR